MADLLIWMVKLWNVMINQFIAMVSWDFSDFSQTLYESAVIVNQALVPVGEALCLIMFLMGLAKSLENAPEIRPVFIIKHFGRLIGAYVCVELSVRFMMWFWKVGIGLVQLVSDIDAASPLIDEQEAETIGASITALLEFDTTGFNLLTAPYVIVERVMDFINGMIPFAAFALLSFLIVGVIAIALYIYILARFMKILITLALAPIGISFFAGEPTSRTGMVFIKSYMGDCLFGCVLAVILKIYGVMMATDIFQMGNGNNVLTLLSGTGVAMQSELWQYVFQLLIKTILFAVMVFGTRSFIKNKFEM